MINLRVLKKNMWHRKRRKILFDRNAVIALPMRMTVSIVIGAAALSCILFFIVSPCLFPEKITVNASPVVKKIASRSETVSIDFEIKDKDGYPIKEANVRVIGLSGSGEGFTGGNGKTTVRLDVVLESGRSEGYLDVDVKAGGCYEDFVGNDMIKIIYT